MGSFKKSVRQLIDFLRSIFVWYLHRTYRKPFPCHLCGFTDYSEKQALVEHLKNYHNFEKDEIATNVVDFLITKFNFGNEDVEMPPPWNRNFQEIPSLEEPTD